MIIITEREIAECTKQMFLDCGDEIISKHDPTSGERNFSLCIIEQCVALLDREEINDERLIIYAKSMIAVSNQEMNEYNVFLNSVYKDKKVLEKAHEGTKLTADERRLIHEMMLSNLGEYTMKSDDQLCCYTAMKAFLVGLYCILLNESKCDRIGHVDLIVDLDDELHSIKVFEADDESDVLIVEWHSTNKINSMYKLYETTYPGLEKESILDLVSADVIEEDYYFNDERFTIAPSILMKQYLSIIEKEVNLIITLSGFGNKDGSHIKWYDMKNRVRKKSIDIEYLPFKLHESLDALYLFRNGTMHGETNITCSDYEVLLKYKNDGLFKGLSIKKLQLLGKTMHPTVDEISKYF